MLCTECGGRINYINGDCVCDSCGRKAELKLPYENLDVFICDSASDETQVFDKESQMVQQVKDSVRNTGATTYVHKKVVDEKSIADILNYVSASKAKILIFVCSSKESLERIYEHYSSYVGDKTVITLYSGFPIKDFPEALKKYQALNFESIGSMKDLQKGVRETLGIQTAEVDVSKLYKTDYKLTIIFAVALLMSIVVLILAVIQRFSNTDSTDALSLPINAEESVLSDEEIFANAQQLAAEGEYADAIDMFESIHDYGHSVDELSLLFSKYAGYYYDDDHNISFRINKTGSEIAIVEARLDSDGTIVRIEENFTLSGTANTVQFTDSNGSSGSLDIILNNEGVDFVFQSSNIENELNFGDNTYSFSLDDRADTPRAEGITLETISTWLSNRYTMQDFFDDGYTIDTVPWYTVYGLDSEWYDNERSLLLSYYSVDDSGVILVYPAYLEDEVPELQAVIVNERFLMDYEVDNTPFVIDGLFIMPNMDPLITVDYVGLNVGNMIDGYLIVDEDSVDAEFRASAQDGCIEGCRSVMTQISSEQYTNDYGSYQYSSLGCVGEYGEDMNIYLTYVDDEWSPFVFYILIAPDYVPHISFSVDQETYEMDWYVVNPNYQSLLDICQPIPYLEFTYYDGIDAETLMANYPEYFTPEAIVSAANSGMTDPIQADGGVANIPGSAPDGYYATSLWNMPDQSEYVETLNFDDNYNMLVTGRLRYGVSRDDLYDYENPEHVQGSFLFIFDSNTTFVYNAGADENGEPLYEYVTQEQFTNDMYEFLYGSGLGLFIEVQNGKVVSVRMSS